MDIDISQLTIILIAGFLYGYFMMVTIDHWPNIVQMGCNMLKPPPKSMNETALVFTGWF